MGAQVLRLSEADQALRQRCGCRTRPSGMVQTMISTACVPKPEALQVQRGLFSPIMTSTSFAWARSRAGVGQDLVTSARPVHGSETAFPPALQVTNSATTSVRTTQISGTHQDK